MHRPVHRLSGIVPTLLLVAATATARVEDRPTAEVGRAAPVSSPTSNAPAHWAFQPIQRPPVPTVQRQDWVRTPLDAFILARLEKEQVAPSPEADRPTLLRRLSLDLLGLPPSPDEVTDFVEDPRPNAYELVVERLLASPRFGERWARHWLDLAHYGDTDGYEDDKFRPDAWRYRDWVIDAINRDLPYDEFTVWQLAGDLLPNATEEQRLATGFHRMTLSNNAGAGGIQEEYRVKAVKDRLTTTATAWLGLTVGCAECHTHKYDPISLREYYQFYAFFNNTAERTQPAATPGPRYEAEFQQATRAFDDRLQQARQALADYERDQLPSAQRRWEMEASGSAALPSSIRDLLAIPESQRSKEQAAEVRRHFRSLDPELARLTALVPVGDEVGNNRPQPPSAHALVIGEEATPRKSFVQQRGNFLNPGDEVGPAIPAFLPPLRPRGTTPDRLDLARWIVDPAHPLTRRVMVNQVWQALFGQGLVDTPDNLGRKGNAPSHPELLDWLATELLDRGWSRKALIRLVVHSAVYRQSSTRRPELEAADPANTRLARQNRLRVEAECVRDLTMAATGRLSDEIGGPSFQPPLPASLSANKELKNERFMEPSPASHRYRRGIYINVQRTFLFPMLRTFDVADASVCSARRDRSNTPLQALTLLNDPVFWEAAGLLGERVLEELPEASASERVAQLYRWCLGREPSPPEQDILSHLAGAADSARDGSPERAAWTGVARVLLNCDEFITRE